MNTLDVLLVAKLNQVLYKILERPVSISELGLFLVTFCTDLHESNPELYEKTTVCREIIDSYVKNIEVYVASLLAKTYLILDEEEENELI